MNTIRLDGKWQLHEEPLSRKGLSGMQNVIEKKDGWMTATVPGEVHLDLMRAGRMEEPLVSLNAKKSRWPEKRSWWYVKEFSVASAFLKHERQQLVFDGLDLYAQVFLNGELLGEAKNAFIPHTFDVRHRLKKGRNTVVVRLTVGDELVDRSLKTEGADVRSTLSPPFRPYLRKAQFSYGWDWVDCLPNIGIWRGVRLEGHSGIVLHDVRFVTKIAERKVSLDIEAVVHNVHPWSEREGKLLITIQPPNGRAIQREVHFNVQIGHSSVCCSIDIPNPQLWWPNGMGEQPLYAVTVQTMWSGAECDRREYNIGLRTVELDRSPLPKGTRFCIRVNGQDVFCKGGSWVPADAIMARVTQEKYQALVDEAKNANMNMLRIWGGGIYESPHFYEACDRAGILVWHDFMFACAQYPDRDPHFRTMVREEAEAAIMLLRHHPCIAIWCGDNEDVEFIPNRWNIGKDANDPTLDPAGIIIFGQVLPDVCRALDPERPYWPSTPCGGDKPQSEMSGDSHWWLWFDSNVERRIYHEIFEECKARFVSEYGVIAPCHPDSIKQYLKPHDLKIGSRAWNEHTNIFEKGTTAVAIKTHYADADNLSIEDYVLYGQMFQAVLYGHSIESMRFRKHDPNDDCQGALIWMYNDCWGEEGWTPIDYYLRRKASYYWIHNANAPLKAIVRNRGDQLVTRVVNDTLKPVKCKVHYGWMRFDGKDSRDFRDCKVRSKAITVPANGMIEIAAEKTPAKINRKDWFYTAYLSGPGIEHNPCVWLLAPYRQLNVPKAEIKVTVKGKEIELVSATYCHGVHIEDGGRALLSDNYFDLLPGVPRRVASVAQNLPKKMEFKAL